MDKFGRNYSLTVQAVSGDFLSIAPPLTIEFDINRNTLTSCNTASIRIYNLSEKHRNEIRKNANNYGDLRTVTLVAGYGKNMATIFYGNITNAWSVREGVNFITQIECLDGGYAFANGLFNGTFPAGTFQSDILETMMSQLPGVAAGSIGSYPGSISRGNPYSGSIPDLLNEITNGGFFIDNGKANCLGTSECIAGEVPVINEKSGLLGTPVLEQTFLYFDMLFEPSLFVGQEVQLQSTTFKDVNGNNLNGFYKIISLKHRGMISEAVCGDAITSVGLFYGIGSLTQVVSQ